MRIILIRHGETTWNIEGRYQGQEDTPLSERGRKQGLLLAEALREIPIDLCISSPLQRSYQTCRFCADLHGLPVATDERLTEINHGSWEGVLAGDIAKRYPTEFALWHTQPEKVQMPDGGESLETKTVIYAAGTQRRKLGVNGEKEFSGNGVSYCAVCDAAFYKDKITVVTGGGDTALGDALLLSRFCKKVYLVHRRDSFRAGRALQNRVFATENIEALTNATVSGINGDTKVTSVTLLQNGEEKQLDCNGVFVAVGSVPDTKPLANLVKTDKDGYIIADESGKTSADGIFAGGDIRTKALRQVVTAVSDGANCVISAEKYLDEKQ